LNVATINGFENKRNAITLEIPVLGERLTLIYKKKTKEMKN